MAERFLLDVIVPVYNGAAYIPKFLDRFSSQADDSVRLLFVDDGSVDGSGAMLDERAGAGGFPVKILHQKNAGVSAARNAGLAAAEAEYVTFFDVDDIPAPDYVAALRRAAEEEDGELFVFAQERVTDEAFSPAAPAGESARLVRTPEEQLRVLLADPTRLGVYNVMLRRAFLERTGLRFAEGYAYYEDYDFLYRAFAQARSILATDRVLYYYVLRGGSAMSRFDGARLTCLSLMTDLEAWLDQNAPAFGADYRRWGVARLMWSVLWQAALAAPSYGDFRRFCEKTFAGVWMKKLRGFPSRRVALSRRLFALSRRAYYRAVRRLGGRRSRVGALSPAAYEAASAGGPDPRRVLLYGMTDNPGGIESYVMGLVRRQKPGTFDLLCDFPAVAYADELAARDVRVHFIPAKSRSVRGHWRGTVRILREHPEYTAVYCNVLDAGCVFTAAAVKRCGRRVVVHSHNGDTDKVRLHRLCRPLLALVTDGRAACSDEASRHMFGRTGSDILFVPNAVDGKKYAYDPAVRAAKRGELGLADGQLAVCHVGRLSRQKNPLGLLDIFAAVRARRPDAVLLSVGEGELAAEFDAAAAARGLSNGVLRLGRRPDVPALLQAADVFLLPSLYEGLSIALVEAQAAGLPAVASDVLSPRTVFTDGVTLVSLDAGPEAWADAVLTAAEAPRRNAYDALVRAGFDVTTCAESDERLMGLLWGK